MRPKWCRREPASTGHRSPGVRKNFALAITARHGQPAFSTYWRMRAIERRTSGRIYASRGPYFCIYPEDTIMPCKWTHTRKYCPNNPALRPRDTRAESLRFSAERGFKKLNPQKRAASKKRGSLANRITCSRSLRGGGLIEHDPALARNRAALALRLSQSGRRAVYPAHRAWHP
jgi:hypothetical protein